MVSFFHSLSLVCRNVHPSFLPPLLLPSSFFPVLPRSFLDSFRDKGWKGNRRKFQIPKNTSPERTGAEEKSAQESQHRKSAQEQQVENRQTKKQTTCKFNKKREAMKEIQNPTEIRTFVIQSFQPTAKIIEIVETPNVTQKDIATMAPNKPSNQQETIAEENTKLEFAKGPRHSLKPRTP